MTRSVVWTSTGSHESVGRGGQGEQPRDLARPQPTTAEVQEAGVVEGDVEHTEEDVLAQDRTVGARARVAGCLRRPHRRPRPHPRVVLRGWTSSPSHSEMEKGNNSEMEKGNSRDEWKRRGERNLGEDPCLIWEVGAINSAKRLLRKQL